MEERILDYGIPPITQRNLYRRLIQSILLVGAIIGVYFLGPQTWHWIRYLYWQQRCLNYTAPPTQLVYDSTCGHETFTPCPPEDEFWRTTGEVRPAHCGIFIHAMRRPDGTKCLVELDLQLTSQTTGNVQTYSIDYTVWTVTPVAGFAQSGDTDFPLITRAADWKIHAAQPDPANPSHFTFDYQLDGHPHTCDAWLNNSNQLVLSTRP
ncbi:MAG: hypothetical protein ABSF29_11490 [Tepidisphaeraceae bacterium]|jgi:hypothetical protein